MIRTQVRIRNYATADVTYPLVDAVASCRVAGFTFLIHRDHSGRGFNPTYAPVGLSAGGPFDTVADAIAKVHREADQLERVIGLALSRMAEQHMPLLSAETGIETFDWQWREECRFRDGDYKPVPALADREYPKEHWAHMSTVKTETDWVSYTPTEAYGLADRQVRLKYGKYLRKTFPDMTDAEVQKAVTEFRAKLALADSAPTLHFATDRETINAIFETEMYPPDCSTTSCMHGKFNEQEIRPYHVYADSPDVAVAYVKERGEIVSRSVVSTKDKTWIRAYSTEQDGSTQCQVLKDLLGAAGYKKGELNGNRLKKLNNRGEVMLPYIDNGGMDVDDDGHGFWRVVSSGEYTAGQTDGTATENRPKCDRCENSEDECTCVYCDCCGESFAGGCDECRMCSECNRCITHNRCACDRCGDCNNIINPTSRYTMQCNCDRCGDCDELIDACECEPETETSTETTPEVTA